LIATGTDAVASWFAAVGTGWFSSLKTHVQQLLNDLSQRTAGLPVCFVGVCFDTSAAIQNEYVMVYMSWSNNTRKRYPNAMVRSGQVL